jgi:hypothetical protein
MRAAKVAKICLNRVAKSLHKQVTLRPMLWNQLFKEKFLARQFETFFRQESFSIFGCFLTKLVEGWHFLEVLNLLCTDLDTDQVFGLFEIFVVKSLYVKLKGVGILLAKHSRAFENLKIDHCSHPLEHEVPLKRNGVLHDRKLEVFQVFIALHALKVQELHDKGVLKHKEVVKAHDEHFVVVVTWS